MSQGLSSSLAEPCDVLIIGGGPAGCTAATLLARRGRDVMLLEQDAHPRFHIGESLLPRNLAILDRLGVRDAVHAIGVFKPGAEFVSDQTGQAVAFRFSLAVKGKDAHAYQVRRSEFDAILWRNAAAAGARCLERTRVVGLGAGQDGRQSVTARCQSTGTVRRFAPRYLLDASGRETFLASRLGSKEANKNNHTAALFAHYTGVPARSAETEGFITVHLVEDGWFWFIPLPDGVTSVGFVGDASAFRARGPRSKEEMLSARIAASPTVRSRMRDAGRLSEVTGTGNYSYRARRSWTENGAMIGDSFAFVDPVFSSGVLMAMSAGEMGAAAAHAWLDDPRRGTAMARRNERLLRDGMDRIGWLIYRINAPELRSMMMAPTNALRMRDGLVSLLAGNLHRDLRTTLPVLAFKSVYYAMRAANRLRATRRRGRPPLTPEPLAPEPLMPDQDQPRLASTLPP